MRRIPSALDLIVSLNIGVFRQYKVGDSDAPTSPDYSRHFP